MLFDTHCHLNSPEMDKEIEKYIRNAAQNGVTKMVVVGYDYQSSLRAIEIANTYPGIYAAAGLQPEEITEMKSDDIDNIEKLLASKKVVAIGEIGLDYHWPDNAPKEQQKEVFIHFLKLSKKYNLPVIIHMRDASEDMINILKEHQFDYIGGVMHCYSGSVETMKEFIKLNMYISLGGTVTFKNAKIPKEVARTIDLKWLLIETDSPYLAPHPLRGTQNEPANVALVAREIANIKNMEYEDIARITYDNAMSLFGLKDE